MARASSTRSYEDFQPSSNLLREEEGDTFVVDLPGFRRDQLRVQIESHGNLMVSGERPIANNRWSRFRKDCLIPKNCNENEIKANFVDGVLYIKMPKSITQVSTQDQAMPKQQAPSNQKTEIEQKSEKVNGGVTDQKTAEDARNEINGIDEKHGSSEPSNGGKVIGSLENQVIAPPKQTSYRFGMGMMRFRFKKPRGVIVNVAVAIVVAVALGIYAKYRLQHSAEAES
ncbi:inactive protein RESTRICTED TEV MOVEMENT 2-like [Macadamia integrifolia]|uniref:inactive protein RESTRICTED TEV MOVEMENT 2-like n=1 Tax=Macadamia integrifolia TaxID=60698 RepID=UPI001C4F4B10|nr:inactive protein RESTRICTED TEV MOVEMENT 2-like [Macadamia integrifolia]